MAALNHCRRRHLAAGDAAFVPAIAAKLLFDSVVGSWQVPIVVAVEKPWPVAPRDLEEMTDGWLQVAGASSMAVHGSQETGQPPTHFVACHFLRVVQNLRCSMHPIESRFHAGPQRRGFLQPAIDQAFQSLQFF